MSKTVSIRLRPNHSPEEFVVGTFVTIEYPGKESSRPDTETFLAWINDLAEKGLIFHSEYNCDYVFRVDGAVIEQLKNELSLDSSTHSSYTGGDPLYEYYTKLQLYLDGEPISTVDLS
jgi:hypothetical protein